MAKYNFDQIIDRSESSKTYSNKWTGYAERVPGYNAEGVLPMWVADMDLPCPDEVVEAVKTRAQHGIYGYTSGKIVQEYLAAASGWLKRTHDYDVPTETMTFIPGVLLGLNSCIQKFTNPGDGVIIQRPVYYPFTNGIVDNDRTVINNALVEKDGYYTINFEELEELAKVPTTQMMVFSSPHNPVGRVWTFEELERVADICLRNNVLLFSDEIHGDLVFPGHTYCPIGKLPEKYQSNVISAVAPSKTFNIAGLGASVLIVPDSELREKMRKQLVANRYSRSSVFGPLAGEDAYRCGDEYRKELLAYVEANMNYAIEYAKENLPGVSFNKPEGTYMSWCDFRGTGLDAKTINTLIVEKAKIGVDLGDWFGPEGDGFARFNFACPRAIVEEAMKRLSVAFGG